MIIHQQGPETEESGRGELNGAVTDETFTAATKVIKHWPEIF